MAAVRAALVKGRSGGDPVCAAAEDTAKELKERIGQLSHRQAGGGRGTGISPARVEHDLRGTFTVQLKHLHPFPF